MEEVVAVGVLLEKFVLETNVSYVHGPAVPPATTSCLPATLSMLMKEKTIVPHISKGIW